MVDSSALQNLNLHDQIVTKEGTATPFFMRLLQHKNAFSGDLADLVAALDAFVINTAAPIAGGPVTLGVDTELNLSHAVSGVTAGTYGDATHVAQITVDADGHVTAATDVAISGGGGGAFRGALVKKSANQTGANYSAGAMVGWNAETYDTDTIHDNTTNNSRLTVPTGVTYVKIKTQVYVDSLTGAAYVQFFKNGSAAFDGNVVDYRTTNTESTLHMISPVLPVTAGDYFEVKLTTPSDSSITIYSSGVLTSWFSMEIVA